MFATIRRIALAIAGAAALIAAGRARADHDFGRQAGPPPAVHHPLSQPGHPPPGYQAPARLPGVSLALPMPPAWLAIAPPPVPAHGAWSRLELEREYRWLDRARVRFYRRAWSPWRVRQFEAWYLVRRAELDRRWVALAGSPGPGWRSAAWDGRGAEGWDRGRADRERWERD